MTFATHYSPAGRRGNTARWLNTTAGTLVAVFTLVFSMAARSENATNAASLQAVTAFRS